LGAYVWRSAVFLDPATREQALGAVAFRRISHLLLSFDAGQIGNLRTGVGRGALLDFLELARRREIRVDLLLGDPAWILPEHRQELVDLVALFGGLPFRGVHLDLEPDQLPDAGARRGELFGELLKTLRIVRERTRRPLSISIHPRYLEAGIVPPSGERLEDLGLEEVLVMIYSTREASVRERMGALMARHPGLRLGLAQSVEPILPPEESYASSGRRIFLGRAASLEGALASPAFGGIFVQSWKDYLEMRP
jgi:hypothetical protein